MNLAIKATRLLILPCLLFLMSSLFQASLYAQCAMCRAGVENNMNNGDASVGAGLNAGILYLLSMPYILIATVAFLWYRHARKNQQKNALSAHSHS
jgi:hypothetical protein